MSDDFFIRLERQLEAAELRELKRAPARRRIASARRLLSAPLAAAAVGVAVVALVAIVMTVARESDVERPTAPPGKKAVATDVERGVRFSLDGRVLTVQLLPDRPEVLETVSGAQISAACGTNIAAPPGDPRRETGTLTRRWPAGQTSLSYRFPRDASTWCRLYDQTGSIVASVGFPGASPRATGPIAETANNWARLFAASRQVCNEYTTQKRCRPTTQRWADEHRGATAQATAISGDRAAATLVTPEGFELSTVQLRRTATGEWLIDKLGEDGLTAELRRKLRGPGAEESAPAPLTTSTPAPKPPLMACIEATGLTVKPLSTADHMIFKDKGTFAVKVVLGEALANQTMAHPERAHRIGRYFFEFHGGNVDRTAIRTCIKENK